MSHDDFESERYRVERVLEILDTLSTGSAHGHMSRSAC